MNRISKRRQNERGMGKREYWKSFGRIFGREEQEPENQARNDGQDVRNPQPAGNNAMVEELRNRFQENEEQPAKLPTQLEKLAQSLRESEKGGLGIGGNSNKFEAVSQRLDKILNSMSKELGKGTAEDLKTLYEIIGDYAALVSACQAYTSRNARTQKGQARRQIVSYIGAQARMELQGFRDYADSHGAMSSDRQAKNLGEVLGKAHERTLELAEGKKDSDLKIVGGAVSSIRVLEKGDLSDAGASGYYKEEDTFTNLSGKGFVFRILKEARKKDTKISDEDYQLIEKAVEAASEAPSPLSVFNAAISTLPKYWEDVDFHRFVEKVKKMCNGAHETREKIQSDELNMFLEENESISMSKRNVAAGRVANLFGVGDLIAQSETASFKDEQGNVTKGNLMQAARGKEAYKVLMDLQRDQFKKQRENNKHKDFSGFLKEGVDDQLTPQFLKSLTSLQVLDNLMGQADRHTGNYMVERTADGKLGRVQGIDNDFAFGYGTQFGFGSHSRSVFGGEKHGRINEENLSDAHMGIPYMDKALADRILAVREPEVRMVLFDVLEPKAIDAFCGRLRVMQDAIRKDRKKNPNSGRYLEKEEDWEKTKAAFRSQIDYNTGDSYVAQFMVDAVSNNLYTGTGRNLFLEERMELQKEFWEHARKNGELSNPQKEYELLRKCGVKEQYCDYLLQGGLLNGDIGILREYNAEVGEKVFQYGRKVLYGKKA